MRGTRNSGKWTEARFRSFIASALRKACMTGWQPWKDCLVEARAGKHRNKLTGRMAEHYICKSCGVVTPYSNVHRDHIEPVVTDSGFSGWDEYIDRLFVETPGWQVLCKECHQIKSNKENSGRRN